MRALAFLVVMSTAVLGAAPVRAGALGVPALSADVPLWIDVMQDAPAARTEDAALRDALASLGALKSITGARAHGSASHDSASHDSASDGAVHAARRTYEIPQRYAFAFDESRAFWFAAGASAAVSLGSHMLIGVPSMVVAAAVVAGLSAANPVVAIPLLVAAGGAYLALHAVGAGIVTALVFNGISDVYEGSMLSSIGGHLAGDVLAGSVTALMFGSGGTLLGGLTALAGFTGSAGFETVAVLSVLGGLAGVVVAGVALVCVPAVLGVWALAVTASPAEGFAIAPDWKRPVTGDDLGDAGADAGRPTSSRSARDARALPLTTFAFDVPAAP